MADIYDRGRALAIKQLALRPAGKGVVFVLARMVDADPSDPNSVPTPTNYTGSAVRLVFQQRDINGTTVMAGDVRFLVSPVLANGADMPDMKTGDRVQFDGSTYAVIGPDPLDFVGFPLLHRVHARKG